MYWNHVISKFAIIPYRWIVTLDVLKLYAEENTKSDYCRWIVTLDVLKSA